LFELERHMGGTAQAASRPDSTGDISSDEFSL
jgi:hypothetical protein